MTVPLRHPLAQRAPAFSRMIRVQLTVEFEADCLGPHEVLTHSLVLSPRFANDADAAHAKLLTLMATEDYFELPEAGPFGIVLLDTTTIRTVVVWED